MGEIATESADAELNNVVGSFRKDNLSAELHLDLLEALAKRKSNPVIAKSLSLIEEKRSKDDKLAMWREVLVGGDAEAGRRVFLYKSEVSCLRCHKVQGNGGEVGPDVTAIGTKQKRDYLLEAIVLPNAQIAKGFDSVTLFLNNGKSVSGVLKGETDIEVKIVTAEGQPLTIRKADIDERQVAKSAMPEDVLKYLSKRELRDLVEFLATVK